MTLNNITGLTELEVEQRFAEGKSNDIPVYISRSIVDIIRSNTFTRINAILSTLFLIVLSTGSLINGTFGLLIIANSTIGIVQEIRAKNILDKLSVLTQNKPTVCRSEGNRIVFPNEIVLDDIIILGPGDQVVVDGKVIKESFLEIDESLLTGESDPIIKSTGDLVMSGSFVISGSGAYRVTKVGFESYAAKLTSEASKFNLATSELKNSINKILQYVIYTIIPVGILTTYTQLFTIQGNWKNTLLHLVGALVPMIPEGLVLVTSFAFTIGVVRLGKKNCLVNELPAIESLARADMLCTDKTGTLTENSMYVDNLIIFANINITEALAQLAADDIKPNISMLAIAESYPIPPGWEIISAAPFSSVTKWSGVSYKSHGNWLIGAPDVLLKANSRVVRQAEKISSDGKRVLLLGNSNEIIIPLELPKSITPVALIIIEQKIRTGIIETLDYFASQNVKIKFVSGDSSITVSSVARKLGIKGKAIDAKNLVKCEYLIDSLKKYSIFGRVCPSQKRMIVNTLRSNGYTVAMTGDGINDILALKEADIGIAMGSGSAASRAIAQIVLLDNDFTTLPYVINEGRRVIKNIERVASLFLTKTVYSVVLALLLGFMNLSAKLFNTTPLLFPFQPIHVTLIAWFTIGFPSFVLSLSSSNEKVRIKFLQKVLTTSLPSGLVIGIFVFISYLLNYYQESKTCLECTYNSTAPIITLLVCSLWFLSIIARPYEWWHAVLIISSGLMYIIIFYIPFIRHIFMLDILPLKGIFISIGIGVIGSFLIELIWRLQNIFLNEKRVL